MRLPVVGKAHEADAAGAGFNWFIYGSSLDRAAFTAWAKEHGYVLPDFSRAVPAKLTGYKLAFLVQSKFWGGAVATLEPDANGTIEGISLPMPADAKGLVDHKEGAISGLFEPFAVKIQDTADGRTYDAVAYRAVASRKLAQEAAPARRYVDTIIQGAKDWHLSVAYIDQLNRL